MSAKRKQAMRPAGGRRYTRRLESLIDASKHLNTTFDLERLLALILHLATKNLAASRGTIYLIDKEKKELWSKVLKSDGPMEIRLALGTGIAGTVAVTGETVNLKDVRKDSRFFSGYDQRSGFRTRTMLCMPMRNRQGEIIGVFQIINKKNGVFDHEDELFLEAFSEHAALAIENARLYLASLAHERMQKELQIAADIQQRLLPKEVKDIHGYDVSAVARPCAEVGGDFYDVVPLDDHRNAFIMADVAGKGVPAALLVSGLHASLHVFLQGRQGLSDRLWLTDMMGRLNTLVFDNSPPEKFITLFVLILDSLTHSATYVNAGHNPPCVIRAADRSVQHLEASGLPLGMLENMTYEALEVTIAPGDALLLYTDGVTECMNSRGEQYGEDRMHDVAMETPDINPHSLRDRLLQSVDAFAGGHSYADDLTLLILKRT